MSNASNYSIIYFKKLFSLYIKAQLLKSTRKEVIFVAEMAMDLSHEKETKRKNLYTATELGFDVNVYIDKNVKEMPDTITLNLKK